MEKKLNDILTDGVTPTEEMITDEMVTAEAEGFDIDRVVSLTLEKTGVKAAKKNFFRAYYKQISALAACLVLFVGVFAAYRIWGGNASVPNTDDDFTNAVNPVDVDDVIWADDIHGGEYDEETADYPPEWSEGELDIMPDVEPEDTNAAVGAPETGAPGDTVMDAETEICVPDEVALVEWNGITMEWWLYCELTQGDGGGTLAVRVNNTLSSVPPEYVYNGKSISEWNEERLALWEKSELIWVVYKYGFDLVYGEALYTTGAPTGVHWSKEHYDEIMSEYGDIFNEIYAEYEKFLTENGLWDEVADDIGIYWEKMEAVIYDMCDDINTRSAEVAINIDEARETYIIENSILLGLGSDFYDAASSLAIPVYANGNHAYIFATAEKLGALAGMTDCDGLVFALASKKAFESEFDENGNPVPDTTGVDETYDETYILDDIPVPDTEWTDSDVYGETAYDIGTEAYDEWETETGYDPTA